MSSKTIPVHAVRAAPEISSAEQLENWLAEQVAPVGTIDKIPATWCQSLMSLPHGFIARVNGSVKLCRVIGKEVKGFFPDQEPLPSGQIFFFEVA
jgi:hypothetical protein